MSDVGPQPQNLTVRLLFDRSPDVDRASIESLTRQALPDSRLVTEAPGVMIAHDRLPQTFADGETAVITTVITEPGAPTGPDEFDLSQSWEFPDAAEVLDASSSQLIVSELFGVAHEPSGRVAAFSSVLRAAVELLRPAAIWAPHSTQLIQPHVLLDNELAAFVNVRLFKVESERGVMVMDTLGLHVFGLPDLQCHFRDLDPADVALCLYNTAAYVLDAGDVIADGNTISGIEGTEHWRCRHELALVEPERVVVDVDTGDPYAAGERDRSKSASPGRWWRRSRGRG